MAGAVVLGGVGGARRSAGETCTTQSEMKPADRDALQATARDLAAKVQANDVAGLRGESVAEITKDFAAMEYVVGTTAPRVKGGTAVVDQLYLLDGTQLKGGAAAAGATADAQFFCTLNRSQAEADFLIPGLTPGRYGFAVVNVDSATAPWRLSFLLRQDGGRWLLAGFYQKPASAAGHDGVWFWRQAREMNGRKEKWNAWLYYGAAENLLRPVNFVQSTHLEKLLDEQRAAAPPALADGVSTDAPLVVKGADGAEYHFTGLGVDDSLAKDKVDVAAHLKVESIGDAAAARKRNADAMSALVAAYPEMRKAFHGVWIYAEAAGQNPFSTEQAMTEVR